MGTKKMRSNFEDENLNPCFDEGKLTAKCLRENFYDSEKCNKFFENYRNCLHFWGAVKRFRRKNSIEPVLPEREEREKILKEREKGNYIYEAK